MLRLLKNSTVHKDVHSHVGTSRYFYTCDMYECMQIYQ